MILLLGGTSETAPLAETLARAGYAVLVSTATDLELFTGNHPRIQRRHGPLDQENMARLIRERGIRALVDATHPFARQAHETASRAAAAAGIPCLRFERPRALENPPEATPGASIQIAADHAEAARLACAPGLPILLTIGSRNAALYASEAQKRGVPIFARVLDCPESLRACAAAGIPQEHVITGRGPFDTEENRRLIARHGIGVLVTKESGKAGGVPEKLEAARLEGVRAIVVKRPEEPGAFHGAEALLKALKAQVPVPRCRVLLLDLESVLTPEIWEAVAAQTGVPELASTTRDIPEYAELMRRRIRLCRKHGLKLSRLREIAATLEPLPGARAFLGWVERRALAVIATGNFHELADPLLAKLGSPLAFCNGLRTGSDEYITGYDKYSPEGKAGAVARFQRLGWRVAAVGDSFNDEAMLKAADAAFLFHAGPTPLQERLALPTPATFDELQNALSLLL